MTTAAQRARRDRRIRELVADGMTLRAVAKRVGTSAPNVCRVLATPPAKADPGTVVARPSADNPAVDPGPAVRQADYERGRADGQREAERLWQVQFPCAVCGRPGPLPAADAIRLGVPAMLTQMRLVHRECDRAR